MADITSSNAVFAITIPLLFPIPQKLQGFTADDVFDTTPAQTAQTVMGVDGIMSGGFTPYIVEQGVHLQADSPSAIIFETWQQAQKATRSIIPAAAVITLSSIRRKYVLTFGILQSFPSISDAKKILQPRKFVLHWQDVSPAPF